MFVRHTRRHARRKTGFTLIELLVVMAIIAVLMGLLMAAVQNVRESGERSDNTRRMRLIASAVSGLKDPQNGLNLDYIPSRFVLKSSYSQSEPEYHILKKAWPRLDFANTGLVPAGAPEIVLDGNQALLFFLTGGAVTGNTGFSTNARYPFQRGGSRKGPYLELTSDMYITAPNGQYWFVDPHGTPYAYFAAVKGKPGAYGGQSFTVPGAGTTTPLSKNGAYINDKGFQIISAGRDRMFGPGGPLPASGNGEDDMCHDEAVVLGGR